MFVRLPGQTRDKNVEVSVAVPTVEVRREQDGNAENEVSLTLCNSFAF